jgi:hypothetical protein
MFFPITLVKFEMVGIRINLNIIYFVTERVLPTKNEFVLFGAVVGCCCWQEVYGYFLTKKGLHVFVMR